MRSMSAAMGEAPSACIAGQRLGGKRSRIDEGVVEDGRARVLVDALDVFRGGEAEALIGLRHQVADEDAQSAGVGQRRGNAFDEEIGDQRGVERARSHGDEVGALDGLQRLRQGRRRWADRA